MGAIQRHVAGAFVVAALLSSPSLSFAEPTPSRAPRPESWVQQLLANTSEAAGIAALGAGLIPGAQVPAVIFLGISLTATALEIGFYSDDPLVDTVAVAMSMGIRVDSRPLAEDVAQRAVNWIAGAGGRALRAWRDGPGGSNVDRGSGTRGDASPPRGGPSARGGAGAGVRR